MLTAGEISSLKTEVARTFTQTLDIWRGSSVADDGYGGRGVGVPALLYSGIACEVYPGVAHVTDVADFSQLVSNQTYTISVPVGTDVQTEDVVVVGSLRLLVQVVLEPEALELQMRFIADKEALNA